MVLPKFPLTLWHLLFPKKKTVLPCTILCSYHVYQHWTEREGFGHSLPWVLKHLQLAISSGSHLHDFNRLSVISGMTVEVLGTLIGTAVQGQIVGMANAPCISSGKVLNSTDLQVSPDVNITEPHVSLDNLVRNFFLFCVFWGWLLNSCYIGIKCLVSYASHREMLTWSRLVSSASFMLSVLWSCSLVWKNKKVSAGTIANMPQFHIFFSYFWCN